MSHSPVCPLFLVLATASCCYAQITGTLVREWVDDTHTVARLVLAEDELSPAAVQSNYDSCSGRIRGGVSEPVGLLRIGSHEVGDDLDLINNPGILSTMYTSVANLDQQNRDITQTTTTNRWYDRDTGELLLSFTFTQYYALPVAPGASYRVRADDGFWSFLNLQLPSRIYFTEQETDVVGAGPESIGRIITSPITLGSSSNFIRDFTDGIDIDLGPNQVNLCYAVRSTPIPAPATAGAMAASLLISLRRRR